MAGKPDLERIQKRQVTRLNVQDSLICFLCAFQGPTKAIHWAMSKQVPEDVFTTLSSQWIVFIVRAFETYFREVFLKLCMADETFRNKVVSSNVLPKITTEILFAIENGKQSSAEIFADVANFQNLDSIQSIFEPALGKNFISKIGEEKPSFCCFNKEKSRSTDKLALAEWQTPPEYIWPDWSTSFYRIFRERHEIIHNANYKPSFDRSTLSNWEKMSLLLGQLLAIKLSNNFEEPQILIKRFDDNQDHEIGFASGPFVLFIDDLLKTDFATADAGDKSLHILEESENGSFKFQTFSTNFRKHKN